MLGGADVVAQARNGGKVVEQHHAQSFAHTSSGAKRGGRASSSIISTSTTSVSRAVAGRGGGGRTSTASASGSGGGSGGGGRVGAGRAQPSMSESGYQLGAKPRKGGLQQSSSVSESDVAALVAMGFDRHAAASALRDAGGDVQGAIDMLTS
jgi:NACalpha-BTF3-like transcription factor